MSPAPTPIPRRVLRPGLRVVRRDDRHLQVGLDAPHRLVVEDRPDVRRVLSRLAAGSPVAAGPAADRVVAQLLGRGMLVDADLLDAAVGRAARQGGSRAGVLACFARHGDAAPDRLAARASARVLLDAPGETAATATRLLRATGIGTVASPVAPAPVPDRSDAPAAPVAQPVVALVVARDEPTRDRLDPLVRQGVPHLLLTVRADGVRQGPFVVPGVTACLRCLDAHRSEHDPRRATVLEQCARGDEDAGDPVLAALGLAAAVADVVGFVDGDRPATWSATVDLGAAQPVVRPWPRHPHCGCAWDTLSATA